MSKNHFNSNETLEMCDVKVSQDGRIDIETKPHHAAELGRLGQSERAIRGRVMMEGQNLHFAPYAEDSRRPTFSKQVVVGSTTISVTEDKVKIAFLVGRHMSKEIMLMYIQSEIDEVKRRMALDVYDSVVSKRVNDNDNVNVNDNGKVNVSVNVNVEKEGGQS